jgi:hypothetical protein
MLETVFYEGDYKMTIEIVKGEDNPVAKFFSSPTSTPETDAFRDSQFTDRVDEMNKLYDLAEKLERKRNELFEALSKIETVFVDGEDTYEDWRTMGNIAREALEKI